MAASPTKTRNEAMNDFVIINVNPKFKQYNGAMKEFVITNVNPKFKQYNHPFKLALCVGIPSIVLTLMLFVVMMTQCTAVVHVQGGLRDLLEKNPSCSCVNSNGIANIWPKDVNGSHGHDAKYGPCHFPGKIKW